MQPGLPRFQVRKCESPTCGLRYPYYPETNLGENCPRCRGITHLVVEEDRFGYRHIPDRYQTGVHLEALLDNIRSAWNVGSMFRTADGAGFGCLHLCGITPSPENTAVLKTSLGAEKFVAWDHNRDAVEAAQEQILKGYRLWAIETIQGAVPLDEVHYDGGDSPIILVVGNELCGVDPGLLDLCERVIYLPMYGIKRSYNVAVAFGIAAHYLSQTLSSVSRSSPKDR